MMASALDESSADAEVFVSLTGADGHYRTGFGSHLVAVTHAALAPQWRGIGGLGRYLTGSALLLICDFATCIALHLSPFDLLTKYDGNVSKAECELVPRS
ncbi:hypothetical protein [Promicromonospora soli]